MFVHKIDNDLIHLVLGKFMDIFNVSQDQLKNVYGLNATWAIKSTNKNMYRIVPADI